MQPCSQEHHRRYSDNYKVLVHTTAIAITTQWKDIVGITFRTLRANQNPPDFKVLKHLKRQKECYRALMWMLIYLSFSHPLNTLLKTNNIC